MKYRIIENHDIDKTQWDNYIGNATHPTVYALSWYLDIVVPKWSALIIDDWRCVMPLPIIRRLGIKHIIQPLFCQQLGVFSPDGVSQTDIENIISILNRRFGLISYSFNSNTPGFATARMRTTCELSLSPDYQSLFENYSLSHRKNITKASKLNITIERSDDYESMVNLMRQMYAVKNVDGVKEYHYKVLSNIFRTAFEKKMANLYFSRNVAGEIIGGALFIQYQQRHLIFSARIEDGFVKRVGFLLVDAFIKDFAGRGGILDFAGSDIKGIADFNLGWGASGLKYPVLQNRMFDWYQKL